MSEQVYVPLKGLQPVGDPTLRRLQPMADLCWGRDSAKEIATCRCVTPEQVHLLEQSNS